MYAFRGVFVAAARHFRRALPASLVVPALLALLAAVSPAQVSVARTSGTMRLPLRQSALDASAPATALSLQDVSRLDRWIGSGVRDARWSPDGGAVYFRWTATPATTDDPENDPWWLVDRFGRSAQRVPDSLVWMIPDATVAWSRDGKLAAWETLGRVVVWDPLHAAQPTRIVAEGPRPARHVRVAADGRAVDFMLGEDLYRWSAATGTLRRLSMVVRRPSDTANAAKRWLAAQQLELFDVMRERAARARVAEARDRRRDASTAQVVPLSDAGVVEDAQLSPDGRFLTIRTVAAAVPRPVTHYMDYATTSGFAEVREARGKVGEARDVQRLGVIRIDREIPADSVRVRWLALPEATGRALNWFGPWWSVEGDRAVVEAISQDDHDLWIARLDLDAASTSVINHQRDDAWIGGPPIQPNYGRPGLVEWIPGGRLVFASEAGGWSHLHLAEPDGRVRALTSGPWEVRSATLSRDRSSWLLSASREHPSDDHLYTMPAGGGALTRLTSEEGRSEGVLSPDGTRLAVTYSRSDRLPDLWLRAPQPSGGGVRVTESGSDQYWTHRWLRPEIVTFAHPDGGPLWAGLYRPATPDPRHPAIVYVHGGGYRQFAHRGWSVYGFSHASHYGMINWLVQQGYTVLDFDYRGSAGYGRDYRTDIHRSMGVKDVDGAVAAARWLARTQGVDSTRIGIYGVSYGGFMTLMSLFRYPGVFAGGISAAGVTDWAHYSDDWTSRILGVPADDPEVYRLSSPIYHASGLRDPLLIEHGLVDDNVHFQDAARLVQRLVELGKSFEVIYYPVEPHVIETEPSLLDFHTRLAAFFTRYLLDR
ncbi:MAG: prolyl oligopeptidase family serine peptidase [Gemmatimonadota bacterium]